MVDQEGNAVADFAQVVWRNVGGHADGDAGRAVDEQVRQPRGHDARLLGAPIIVGLEIDRLAVDVGQQLCRDGRHLGLSVAHRRRWIVVEAAEVALPKRQRIAHVPPLRQADEGVVDRGVAVGMIFLEDLTDDARALLERAIGLQAHLVHRVEYAPVDRLEAVTHVGQRAADDNAHRIVQVGAGHLVNDAYRPYDATMTQSISQSETKVSTPTCSVPTRRKWQIFAPRARTFYLLYH